MKNLKEAIAELEKALEFEEWFTKEYPLPPTVERGPIGRDFRNGCKKAWNKSIDRSEASRKDYERRLKAHSAGEAVKHICRDCLKNFWNVDDEPIICPHCGSKDMPIVDPDAEQIA